jgi:predicted amidophosphoribosyltransferase
MRALKNDEFILNPPILMSDFIADVIKRDLAKLPFAHYFETNPILVPTPNSSLTRPGTLWVPQRLANALVRKGLGKAVVEFLVRVTPLQKAATSLAANRPKAAQHYTSMEVQKGLSEPDEILLVDDVVTRGATLLGAANKLADAFPKARIRVFAVMRTISHPAAFVATYYPCIGTIKLVGDETFRQP